MWKVAVLVHLLAMTVISGVLVVAVLTVPALAERGMMLMPLSLLVGFLAAIPPSIWVAKAMMVSSPTPKN